MIYASGIVKDGKLFIRFRREFDASVARLTGGVEITVSKGKRTLSQNAWYWSAVLPQIAAKTGYTEAELDRIFEKMFAPRITRNWRGRPIETVKHCRDLDKNEFSEYIERIRAEAGAFGVVIPEPVKKYGK